MGDVADDFTDGVIDQMIEEALVQLKKDNKQFNKLK